MIRATPRPGDVRSVLLTPPMRGAAVCGSRAIITIPFRSIGDELTRLSCARETPCSTERVRSTVSVETEVIMRTWKVRQEHRADPNRKNPPIEVM